MQFFKFSIFLGSLLLTLNAYAVTSSDQECLNKDYTLNISHKGQPFGLTQNILNLEKRKCVFSIRSEKLKYLKNNWIIDVCREPVHIKMDSGSIIVLKKGNTICHESEKKADYCNEYYKMMSVLQDYGLIFAEGEKENINTDHGKVYCAYDIIRKYLFDGQVFSRYQGSQPEAQPQRVEEVIPTPVTVEKEVEEIPKEPKIEEDN